MLESFEGNDDRNANANRKGNQLPEGESELLGHVANVVAISCLYGDGIDVVMIVIVGQEIELLPDLEVRLV